VDIRSRAITSIKKNEITLFAGKWVKLNEVIVFNEKQTKTEQVLPSMWKNWGPHS
jgi:hypothetical protein